MAVNFVQELDISPNERLQVHLDCAWLQQGTLDDFSAPRKTCLTDGARSGGNKPFASLLVMLPSRYEVSQTLPRPGLPKPSIAHITYDGPNSP